MKAQQYCIGSHAVFLIVVSLFVGCKNQSTEPTNHYPVITSFVASSSQAQLADSFSVACSAYDADEDSLAYNWGCPSYLIIKGASPLTPYQLQNTKVHTVLFYTPDSLSILIDTITISCGVVDGRGGWASTSLLLPIKR